MVIVGYTRESLVTATFLLLIAALGVVLCRSGFAWFLYPWCALCAAYSMLRDKQRKFKQGGQTLPDDARYEKLFRTFIRAATAPAVLALATFDVLGIRFDILAALGSGAALGIALVTLMRVIKNLRWQSRHAYRGACEIIPGSWIIRHHERTFFHIRDGVEPTPAE